MNLRRICQCHVSFEQFTLTSCPDMTESHRDVMMKTSVTPDLESVCPLGRADLAWLRNMGQARAGRDGPARQERPAVKRSTAQLGLNRLGIISA